MTDMADDIQWFDIDLFIQTIYGVINRGESIWLSAITVNDDLVLVHTDFAWRLIQRQAKRAGVGVVAAIDGDDFHSELKKRVLLSVVDLLRSMRFVDESWVKQGCFHSKFNLIDKDGDKLKVGWYIPFRFDVFKRFSTFKECDQRKNNDSRRIVKAEIAGVSDWQKILLPKTATPEAIDISWFDPDKFLKMVHKKINRGSRGWFTAITVNNGLVLVVTSGAWVLIQKQAIQAGINDVAAIMRRDNNSELKKNVLMSVFEIFRSMGFIDESWVKQGHYESLFDLIDNKGYKIECCWCMPFRFEAFKKFNTIKGYGRIKDYYFCQIAKAELSYKSY